MGRQVWSSPFCGEESNEIPDDALSMLGSHGRYLRGFVSSDSGAQNIPRLEWTVECFVRLDARARADRCHGVPFHRSRGGLRWRRAVFGAPEGERPTHRQSPTVWLASNRTNPLFTVSARRQARGLDTTMVPDWAVASCRWGMFVMSRTTEGHSLEIAKDRASHDRATTLRGQIVSRSDRT